MLYLKQVYNSKKYKIDQEVLSLLANSQSVNYKDKANEDPLLYTILAQDEATFDYIYKLIDKNIIQRGFFKNTHLHSAVEFNFTYAFNILLSDRIDLSIQKNGNNKTALDISIEYNSDSTCLELINNMDLEFYFSNIGLNLIDYPKLILLNDKPLCFKAIYPYFKNKSYNFSNLIDEFKDNDRINNCAAFDILLLNESINSNLKTKYSNSL